MRGEGLGLWESKSVSGVERSDVSWKGVVWVYEARSLILIRFVVWLLFYRWF